MNDFQRLTFDLVTRYAAFKHVRYASLWSLLWKTFRERSRIFLSPINGESIAKAVTRLKLWDKVYPVAYSLFR
jgi:hypothetical protein